MKKRLFTVVISIAIITVLGACGNNNINNINNNNKNNNKVVAKSFSVVASNGQETYLLGGMIDGSWIGETDLLNIITTPVDANINLGITSGKEKYKAYSNGELLGSSKGSAGVLRDDNYKYIEVLMETPMEESGNIFYVSGDWDCNKIKTTVIDNDLNVKGEMTSVLVDLGVDASVDYRFNAYSINIDSDNGEEILMTASYSVNSASLTEKNDEDYLIYILKSEINGEVTYTIVYEWYGIVDSPKEICSPAFLDLDGDGTSELLISFFRANGFGIRAYEIIEGSSNLIMLSLHEY